MTTSTALLKQIEKHPRFIASKTILLYHSLGDEVQTHDFVEKWYQTKKILLPVVQGDILVLRHYTGKECLCAGAFHIEEPGGEDFTNYEEIEMGIIYFPFRMLGRADLEGWKPLSLCGGI